MKTLSVKFKVISICLVVLLICSVGMVNLSVSAETEPPTYSADIAGNTYQYTITNGEATIVKAEAKGDVIIPESLDGYPVTALADKAFYYLWDITSVKIPGCVKTIGESCFQDCINMENAVLEDGVEKIGAYAFYSFVVIWGEDDIEAEYYSSFESLVLPDSVKYIGESAFLDTLLSGELKLPASLQYLGESAFSGTRIEKLRIPATMVYNDEIFFSRIGSLKEIVIDAGNTNYHLDDELLIADSGKVALYFIGNIKTEVVVPDTTEVIASNCFTTTRVQKVTLPTSLREIEKEAFKSCGELTEIVIPDGVITIGDKAFSSCSKVVDIQLPTTLTTVGQDAFSNCSSLVKLSIPAGTLTLGDGAFGGCRSLQEVEFTGNDVTLGKSVFYNCLNMNKMTLSASKMYLGASLFAKTGIETLVIDSNDITTDPDLYLERELYYPGYNDSNLKKLVISKNVTTLNEALYLPVTIWQAEVEDGNTTYAIEDNVLYNSDKTELIRFFSNNAEYTYRDKFTVPETVTKIGNKAFFGARVYLVELPSALEIIGDQAFYNSSVSGTQEKYAFTLPASVKKIGSRAFGITPIRYFNIMEGNLERLTPNMFQGAYALTDVYYTGDKEKLDKIISYTEGSYLSSCRFHYNTTSSEHPFTKTIGKKATAYENGYYLYTCPCEQSYTLPIHKINEFIVAYSTVADHFSTEVSVAPAHQLPTRLINGKDYTYQLSTYDAKYGHLAIKYSFMGDLYEGTYTKVEPIYIPAVKSLTVQKTTTDSVTLTWEKESIAKGYKIWRQEDGKDTWELIATTSELSYTDSALNDNTTYQYKVAAYITVVDICEIISDNPVTISATTVKAMSNGGVAVPDGGSVPEEETPKPNEELPKPEDNSKPEEDTSKQDEELIKPEEILKPDENTSKPNADTANPENETDDSNDKLSPQTSDNTTTYVLTLMFVIFAALIFGYYYYSKDIKEKQ